MNGFSVASLLVWYVVFLFSTTFHEFAHSIVAYWAGDSTAYEGGQVTLDPLPHIRREPVGLVIVPLISFFFSGYMLGWASAPIDPRWARSHPGRAALMSAAGPLSNFLLATIAGVVIKILVGTRHLAFSGVLSLDSLVVARRALDDAGPMGAVAMGLSILFCLNVMLGVFNLLPVPPLDGAHVVEGLSPRKAGSFYDTLRGNPGLSFLAFIVAWKFGSYLVVVPVLRFATGLL